MIRNNLMSIPYPLYDKLLAAASSKNSEDIDASKLCATIKSLSNLPAEKAKDHYDEIYGLIIHHEVKNGGAILSVPYKGRTMYGGNGILYQITELPPLLQKIIALYLEEYSKKSND